ncbi:MAG: hypothetical protein L0H53_13765 [Candidatus Nitrosocosmicus sp.]|nr:hypothetical protein [Candidatus Nitrosocosmicus sp.]
MVKYFLELQLTAIPIFLFLFLITTSDSIFGQENANPARIINVTQDMIDLLTGDRDLINNNQSNSTLDSNSATLDSALPELNKTKFPGNDFSLKSSQSLLLEDKILPDKSFMYIYDTTPYVIVEAHLTAELPCDENRSTDVTILVGKMPNFDVLPLEFIPQFSEPGEICIYQTTMISNETNPISEIAIANNSTEEIEFSPTSSIVIGIVKLADSE